jgi:hypothetical protein
MDRPVLGQLPPQLSPAEQDRIRALAADIPALWQAATTTNQDRKEIVRLLLERVVVQVRPDSEYVEVTLHWHGGSSSRHTVLRPVQRFTQLRDYEQLLERLVQLRHAGYTSAQIADQLNQEGFRPPRRCGGFLKITVRQLLSRCGLAHERTYDGQLGDHEWWLPDLAQAIPMSAFTLRLWARQGRVEARRTPAQGLWIVKADPREVKRLRKLHARLSRGSKDRGPRFRGPENRSKAKAGSSSSVASPLLTNNLSTKE